MSAFFLVVPCGCYIVVAISQGFKGDWANVVIYLGYAVACFGALWKLT